MNESSFASTKIRVYRFNLAYKIYHVVIGVIAFVGAIYTYQLVIVPIGLLLFSIFMISRPFRVAVIVDQNSVTLKSMFSKSSIQSSSITAYEFKAAGKSNFLILWGNIDEKEKLAIPDLFAFDDAWDNWLRSYRDLSDGKPLSPF